MSVKDSARGRWYGILRQLGVDDSFLQNRHGACPACGGKDRYRWDDKDGDGTYFCSGCGAGDGFDLLMKINNWDFKTAAKEIEKIVGQVEFKQPKPKKDPLPKLKKISEGAKPVNESETVLIYLKKRGLKIFPQELRGHDRIEYFEAGESSGFYPAMLAVVKDAGGNNLTYHITHLTKDGNKANVKSAKKIMPPIKPIAGGAIRLFGIGEHICLSEGIETAIAAHEATGLPSWATISAGGLESFQVPNGVDEITIFADNDKSYTGQKAAYALANRLTLRNSVKTHVIIPMFTGDFLDVWTADKAEKDIARLPCLKS